MDAEALIPILRGIQSLLTMYGYDAHAEQVAELLDLATVNPTEFQARVIELEVWGGAGSVADVSLYSHDVGPVDETRVRADARELWRLMVELADELRHQGIHNQRMDAVARVFRKVLERWDK